MMPERQEEPKDSENREDRPVRVVHLRRAEYDDIEVRRKWQARGYATMPPMEGHDPHKRCPVCSTDCQDCGSGPCLLDKLLDMLLGDST